MYLYDNMPAEVTPVDGMEGIRIRALVVKVRKLMHRAMHEKEFAAWLHAVRIEHKAKRNFMQRLDKVMAR